MASEPAPVPSTGRIALAWILAIAGFVLAFIVSLAGAMKTVPSISLGEAAVGVPLPLLGLAVAVGGLRASARAGRAGRATAFALAFIVSILALVVALGSYLAQPGGPR